MGRRTKNILRTTCALLGFVAVTVLVPASGSAGERMASLGNSATTPQVPVYAAVGEPTRAPIGWVEFCI